jgi:hypothetical protein
VATIHDTVKESGRVLPHPSAVFHAYASTDTPWVAPTLSRITSIRRYGIVQLSDIRSYLVLGIPYVPYALVYSMLVHQGLTDAGLN